MKTVRVVSYLVILLLVESGVKAEDVLLFGKYFYLLVRYCRKYSQNSNSIKLKSAPISASFESLIKRNVSKQINLLTFRSRRRDD